MLSPVLARTLAAARPWFNERATEARHRQPGFDLEGLRDFIETELDAIAVAVARVEPDRVGEVVQAAYEVGIELIGQRLVGPQARSPWVRRSWQVIVPSAAPLLVLAPRDILGALSNAAVQLGVTPGVRSAQWIDLLAGVVHQCADVDMFRYAGAVCAWRAGMVSLRDAALVAGERLPTRIAMACLGLDPDAHGEAAWSRLRADRWLALEESQAPGHVLGGFTGFGGVFSGPPSVRVDTAGFIARAGDRVYALDGDAFGAAALSARIDRFDAARQTPVSLGRPLREALAVRLQVPEEGLVATAHGQSLVVASPWSHRVFLGPRAS